MRNVIPTDNQFKSVFATARVSQSGLARYYLRVLEMVASGDDAEMVPNQDTEVVNLEHVLPEKPLSNWPQFSTDDAKAYVNRIGNLALMNKRLNSDIKSEEFSQKKTQYASSPFTLTSSIANYSEWTPKEIDDRQANLAELAVRAWTLKV